jgi:predicted RNA-binding Zn-ribbon protein involved in translation (DUF1610 family)
MEGAEGSSLIGSIVIWIVIAVVVILGVLYAVVTAATSYARDVKQQCPKCNNTGVLKKIGEKVKNKRRTRGSDKMHFNGKRMTTRATWNTTEYWVASYKCSRCGYTMAREYTRTYNSG